MPALNVLFETPLGFCLFAMADGGKLESGNLYHEFESAEGATNLLKLKAIHKFKSTADAVSDISSIQEGKLNKSLRAFLTKELAAEQQLIVQDKALASSIAKKMEIKVMHSSATGTDNHIELFRGIRSQLQALLIGLDPRDLKSMSLGLSHSLSRYKIKFSPDKVDIMVVQAIALLDDLDKELNIYAMRVKEWYGWHFPEMAKFVNDNLAYASVVKQVGFRDAFASSDFSSILPEEVSAPLITAAQLSMGTEISDVDLAHIQSLADQVISISQYRAELFEYLRNRMAAIAPNLTSLVGELVGARLISHAGSLLSLAKYPASTVQILGAEKALFRALKTKHDTPKYGLIYHASLVGQAPQKLKGKMARMLATKTALSIRVDALSDADSKATAEATQIGLNSRVQLESRLRNLERQAGIERVRGGDNSNSVRSQAKFDYKSSNGASYNSAADQVNTLIATQPLPGQSNGMDEETEMVNEAANSKKAKKEAKRAAAAAASDSAKGSSNPVETEEEIKKRLKKEAKKAAKQAEADMAKVASIAEPEVTSTKSSKKDKKRRAEESAAAPETVAEEPKAADESKKSKKRKTKAS